MEKKQAIQLISDTLNATFDEKKFTNFINNLLNDIESKTNRYSGQMLWDDHKDHINSYKRIGKYTDPDGEPLDVLIVEVKTIAKLERARTALRNFAIKHLKKFDKDFALVAFYAEEDGGRDWRFSFIKLEHQSYFDEGKDKVKIKEALTPAKRYSFLVGEDEQSHTAKTQLLPLLQNLANNPTVAELENAFSIEKVTDEFFNQYKDLYVKLYEHFNKDNHIKQELSKVQIDNARFTKKLLGQIVFLYFLQKKGWLGVSKNEKWGKGQKRFIQDLFDQAQNEKVNFFKDKLQYLFYEALAKERTDEKSFYERFNCRIPFLNGGLFEAEYQWKTANITIPENLFRNQEKNKAGDIGTGILDIFDRYNFTIKEDEPLDKEVAVDPEMLGKVFENMLEITERKSKGAFYTPREIVHYMCQESLIHYLDNCLNSSPPFKEEYPQGEVVQTPSKYPQGEVVQTPSKYPQGEVVQTPSKYPQGEVVQNPNLNNLPYLKTFRKNLRNNLTPAEATLWKLLQKKQLDGRKFRRQHSVANYILDFYCLSEKLAIELDGQGHFEATQAEYDKERDLFLKHCGIKVLRFENKWVWENTDGLLQAIKDEFGWSTIPAPTLKGGELVPRADIETYIRKGHNALENDQRVAKKGETKTYKYILPKSIRDNADLIDQKLTHIKICDPAIGSGAFPVGLLHELVNAQLVIKPHFSDKYLKTKLNEFQFNKRETPSESRYIYRLKRHIIQESIYGVDIDASAIDIARLRLWLSLVVDEDDFDPIETLPNLDYKIVCGNSLISRYPLDMPIDNVFKEFNKKVKDPNYPNQAVKKLVGNKEIDLAYYKKLTNDFLLESSHEKKEVFRELIKEIKNAFKTVLGNKDKEKLSKARGTVENLKQSDIFGEQVGTKTQINKAKKHLAKLEKEKQDTQEGVLFKNAIEWRFEFPNLLDDNGVFVGFDVVIGNPPYIQLQKALPNDEKLKYADLYKTLNFKTFERTGDIYALFYEKGIQTLTKNGALIYITSNKWMRANYGKSLRKFFSENNPLLLLDLGPGVFDTATVDSNILQVEKKQSQNQIKAITLNNKGKVSQLKETDFVNLPKLNEEAWIILSKQEQKIKDRIEQVGTPLKDWDINIYRGVLTGYNEAFIINGETKDQLIQQDPKSAEIIKPILRGRDIKRYKADFADLWLIGTFPALKLNIDDYPAIKEYLEGYLPKIKQTGEKFIDQEGKEQKTRKKTGNKWFETQDQISYFKEFEKEKIVWAEIVRHSQFYFDTKKYFPEATSFLLTGSDIKYLTSLLNSNPVTYFFKKYFAGGGLGEKGFRYKKVFLINLPIPKIPTQNQKPFEIIVDYIITLKEQIHNSTFIIHNSFFEAVIDAMVYELYFEQELKQANKEVLKHLTDLKPISSPPSKGGTRGGQEEKLAIIQSEFERLYHPEHPVRFAVETLDSIEEVRIIKEALK